MAIQERSSDAIGLQAESGGHKIVSQPSDKRKQKSDEGEEHVALQIIRRATEALHKEGYDSRHKKADSKGDQMPAPLDSRVPGAPGQVAAKGPPTAGKTEFACGRRIVLSFTQVP